MTLFRSVDFLRALVAGLVLLSLVTVARGQTQNFTLSSGSAWSNLTASLTGGNTIGTIDVGNSVLTLDSSLSSFTCGGLISSGTVGYATLTTANTNTCTITAGTIKGGGVTEVSSGTMAVLQYSGTNPITINVGSVSGGTGTGYASAIENESTALMTVNLSGTAATSSVGGVGSAFYNRSTGTLQVNGTSVASALIPVDTGINSAVLYSFSTGPVIASNIGVIGSTGGLGDGIGAKYATVNGSLSYSSTINGGQSASFGVHAISAGTLNLSNCTLIPSTVACAVSTTLGSAVNLTNCNLVFTTAQITPIAWNYATVKFVSQSANNYVQFPTTAGGTINMPAAAAIMGPWPVTNNAQGTATAIGPYPVTATAVGPYPVH